MPEFGARPRGARAGQARAAGAGRDARAGAPRAGPPAAARLRDRRAGRAGPRRAPHRRRGCARRLRAAGQEALARLVTGASDEQLERRFGSALAQRAIFTGIAKQFEPKFAHGFEGDIAYELSHHGNGKLPSRWTLRVRDGAAAAVQGIDGTPAITFKLSIPDFARLLAEQVEPQELMFSGRFDVQGDLGLATRVPEMFGAAPQF